MLVCAFEARVSSSKEGGKVFVQKNGTMETTCFHPIKFIGYHGMNIIQKAVIPRKR